MSKYLNNYIFPRALLLSMAYQNSPGQNPPVKIPRSTPWSNRPRSKSPHSDQAETLPKFVLDDLRQFYFFINFPKNFLKM